MKKGNLELRYIMAPGEMYTLEKENWIVQLSKQDLKDLRDCIDEVLGEEYGSWHCGKHKCGGERGGSCPECNQSQIQPLKEEKRICECGSEWDCVCDKIEAREKEMALKEEEGECRIKSCTGDSECLEHCPCDCHQEKETEKFCTQVGCKAWGDHAHGKVEVKKETEKETPKKLPSEVCYCGHPKESHSGIYSNGGRGDTWMRDICRHCVCTGYAEDELHNQGKINH